MTLAHFQLYLKLHSADPPCSDFSNLRCWAAAPSAAAGAESGGESESLECRLAGFSCGFFLAPKLADFRNIFMKK